MDLYVAKWTSGCYSRTGKRYGRAGVGAILPNGIGELVWRWYRETEDSKERTHGLLTDWDVYRRRRRGYYNSLRDEPLPADDAEETTLYLKDNQ